MEQSLRLPCGGDFPVSRLAALVFLPKQGKADPCYSFAAPPGFSGAGLWDNGHQPQKSPISVTYATICLI
jgi:hypothetical protein